MTDTTYTGVLGIALKLVPSLRNDPDQPQYEIKPDDAPYTVAAKVYDAFLYGMSDEQFQMLEDSAKKSPQRAEEVKAINKWLEDVGEIMDEELDPKDMGVYAERFSDFPAPGEAGDDEDALTVSLALIELQDDEIPTQLGEIVDELEPFLFPDYKQELTELFGEEAEETAGELPAETGELPAEDMDLPAEEQEQLAEGYDLEDGVDLPLEPEAAEAEAEEAAEEPKAEEPEETPAPKSKAKPKAKAKPKTETKAKPAKAAESKAEPAKQEEAAEKPVPARRGRTLKRTGGGGHGIMGDMRRLIVINPDIPFNTVEHVMNSKGVDCKKSTWSPKLSDMRNMLNYLLDLGVVDKAKLDALQNVSDLVSHDNDLDDEQAAQMDKALKELG